MEKRIIKTTFKNKRRVNRKRKGGMAYQLKPKQDKS